MLFRSFKGEIKRLISTEIVKRYYYKEGAIEESLKTDKAFDKAIEVLNDKIVYELTLKPQPRDMPSAEELKEKLKKQYSTEKE